MSRNLLRIEKDLTHSYLYLHGMEWKEKSHEQKIIQQCLIPGTLPFRLIQEEKDTIFQYNFSNHERMVDFFAENKMNLIHIVSLFESIHNTLLQLEEYLLSPEILGLDLEEIVYDDENNCFLFPLVPSASGSADTEIKNLIDFIFDHIDDYDENAILSAYRLQQIKKKENLQIKSILQVLYSQKEKTSNSTPLYKIAALEKRAQAGLYPKESILKNSSIEKCENFPKTSMCDNNVENIPPNPPGSKQKTPFQELDLSDCKYTDYMMSIKEHEDSLSRYNDEATSFSEHKDNTSPISEDLMDGVKTETKTAFNFKNIFKKREKRDTVGPTDDSRYLMQEVKQVKGKKMQKQGLRKILLCLFLMIAFPLSLYLWKGSSMLYDYLPFLILIETAILLYASLDFLSLFFSTKNPTHKKAS